MLLDVFRKPLQSKALYCYVILSLWILLLVAGVYKFLESKQKLSTPVRNTELFHNLAVDVKTKRIFRICNLPEEITLGDEGILEPQQWSLKGVIILIRHGDRGPLQHVRNISNINCGNTFNANLRAYQDYLHNLTVSGKILWIGPGPFHGFPILPTHVTQCQLGQLTMQGVTQLLQLGYIMQRSYVRIWPKLLNLTQSEIIVYSTRYRRTFQSALAFLYTLISADTLSRLNILESQSMSFCFKDCGCPIADKFYRLLKKYISQQLFAHPAVSLLTETTGNAIFSPTAEQGSLGGDPHAVRDALLTYICHASSLPCEGSRNCIKRQNVAGIFTYTDWVNNQKWSNINWKRYCLLKSYGLIKHIVSQMLYMVSNSGPYLVLYSGHDHTLEHLSTALGLQSDPLLLRYAARIVVEVYHDNRELQNGAHDVYFRILSNGKDVTNQIHFCKDIINVQERMALCKIEDIVRFLHDDYFSSLNYTNFKDSCTIRNI